MSLWTLKDSMSSKVTVRGSLQDLDEKMPVSISTTKRQRTNLHSEGKERIIRGHRHTDQTNMRKRKSKRDSVTLRLKVFLRQMRDRVKVRDRLSVKRDKMKEREKQSPYLLGNPAQNGSCILEHRSCFLAGQPVSMLHKSSILSVYYSLHSTASTYECKKTINNRYNEASPHCTLSFLHWDVFYTLFYTFTIQKKSQCNVTTCVLLHLWTAGFIATLNWPAGLLLIQDGLPGLAGFTRRDSSLFPIVCTPAGACAPQTQWPTEHTLITHFAQHVLHFCDSTQPARSVHLQLSIRYQNCGNSKSRGVGCQWTYCSGLPNNDIAHTL